jgi:hypothetical protein
MTWFRNKRSVTIEVMTADESVVGGGRFDTRQRTRGLRMVAADDPGATRSLRAALS